MMEFINDLLLSSEAEYTAVASAFAESHKENKKRTRFTKVQMDYDSDVVLQKYFADNVERVESWFNVISPDGFSLDHLRDQVTELWNKDWTHIHVVT